MSEDISPEMVERWMEWQASDNLQPMVRVFWGLVRTPPEKRDMDEISSSLEVLNSQFEILDAHLSQSAYVAGDKFCMGDIPPGAATHRYYSMDIKRPVYSNLERWYEALQTREAFRKFVMVPLA